MSTTDTQVPPLPLAAASAGQDKDEAIYLHLHTAIFEAHLAPGTRLPEDALSRSFGVSRTIIRKVLQRLGHEGLVDIRPNRGAVVGEPSVDESREVFATRKILECGALPEVVQRATAADLKALAAIVAQEDAAQKDGDRPAAIRLSGEFHVRLAEITANGILARTVSALVARSSLIIATYGSPISTSCRHSEHTEIIELIGQRRTEEGQRWMAEHLDRVESGFAYSDNAPKPPGLEEILQRVAPRVPKKRLL
jgi:DNA-binding GntR family transcriptional regulator